ncbi:MAG: aldo/keto reductase [Bacillota bacterium]|jgi:predicted aldo/keto reductase-like oxidoreductase|nr:4Fe-4S binding protein [Candidatus Fermentithermobacillaceae bacterium]
MKYSILGATGLKVSVLCMGCLVLGPAQYNLSDEESRELIDYAVSKGVNFFDTSELYGVYRQLRCLKDKSGVVISSRSYAASRDEMKASLETARREMNRDKIEIFGLHEQESGLTLKGHMQALEYLAESREKGLIDAVSVSTHYVACVRSAALLPEVDVILAILNIDGIGIADGSRQDMEEALAFARYMGKGVYLMKALGGGHLFRKSYEALCYTRDFPYKDSVCVGVKNKAELDFACGVLCSDITPEKAENLEAVIRASPKRLVVEPWCQGCGKCEEKCGFGAISVTGGQARVDLSKCMLCGYCARVCPYFCLKVV